MKTRKILTEKPSILLIFAFCLIVSASPAISGLREIIPRPQQMGLISDVPMVVTGSFYLVLPDEPTAQEILVKQEVIRLFQEHSLRTPISVEYSEFTFDIPSIWIGTPDRFPALTEALAATRLVGMGSVAHDEEYQIYVEENRVLLLGEDDRGLRWGVLSLIELIGDVNGSMSIDRVYIRDWPDFEERIATVNSSMRNQEQYDYAVVIADSAYHYKMNEIEWNGSELGKPPESMTPWTAAFFFPHASDYKQLNSDRGMKLSVSVDQTGKAVDEMSWQEAIPITNTQMRVTSSGFQLIPDCYNITVQNGGFESWSGSQLTSWSIYRDYLWSHFTRDTSIRHSGTSSVKVQTAGSDLQLHQTVVVQPYGYYNLKFWIKTSGFSGSLYFDAQGPPPVYNGMIRITSSHLDISATQDWTEVSIPFSSYHLDTLGLIFGVNDLNAGTVWFDDVRIEAADLENMVRRSDTPLRVYEEPGHIPRTEGVDYRVVETYSTSYNNYVREPRLERLSGGALYYNDIVSVDWGCAIRFQDRRYTVCFSLLEPLQAYQNKVRVADSTLSPDGFKIHINEVCYAGHDQLCQSRGLTSAQLVGQYCNNMYNIIQSRRPGAPVRIYGDAFDYYTFDPRAIRAYSSPWTIGENGQGTLSQISNNIVVIAMADYSNDIDSTFITYEQYGFKSVCGVFADLSTSILLNPALVARRYSSCKGVDVYGWYKVQDIMDIVGSLAWNTGPYILHSPVTLETSSDSVDISADIWSDSLGQSSNASIVSAIVRYRWLPLGNWIEMNMTSNATDHFAVVIPPTDLVPEGMEYAIIAKDSREQIRRAPAGEDEYFTAGFAASVPNRFDRSVMHISHTTTGVGDYTLIEWDPVPAADYYEIHLGAKPDFSLGSTTLLARQDRQTPRYLVHNSELRTANEITVIAVIEEVTDDSKTCSRKK